MDEHDQFLIRVAKFTAALAAAAVGAPVFGVVPPPASLPPQRVIAPGRFAANWASLEAGYRCPEWFRDAKFGIWAHWSAQSVPEQGDWYARNLYIQGHRQNLYHVTHYGPPSEVGFMEIDRQWTAARWDPDALMQLYVAAGARYFVALANHEDNFDTYASKYHAWNAVNVGPHRDIVGTWAKAARAHGLRFGVSNHSSHAWHWFQTAYGYDVDGPHATVRYDAFRLRAADGVGKWWEGLDPQQLYGPPAIVAPDGFTTPAALHAWHDANNLPWTEDPPPWNPEFAQRWFFRAQDLVDAYDPDFLYLDNTGLPLGQVGLDLAAHFYNANEARHGRLDGVLTAKGLHDERQRAVTLDFERTVPAGLMPAPFEASTCIGEWHYRRDIEYKSVAQIVRIFVDVVSKNGTFLLSIPQRGDGTIDDREVAILHGLARWTKVNGEGIYGSRPWRAFGEGPTVVPRGRAADSPLPYTTADFRFTTKGEALYVFQMALSTTQPAAVRSLGRKSEFARPVASVALVGSDESLQWRQTDDALTIDPPAHLPSDDVVSYRVTFK